LWVKGLVLSYDTETDTLVIEFPDRVPVESEYLENEGVIVDYDENGKVVGIEVLGWSKRKELPLRLPLTGTLTHISI